MYDGLVVAVYLAAILGSLVVGFRYVNGARPRGHPLGRADPQAQGQTAPADGGGAMGGGRALRQCGHCGETNADVATIVYCQSCLGRIR